MKNEKIKDWKNVGSFKVDSGKMMVSDPCYEPGTWCQGVIENVKNGQWNASIGIVDCGSWGSRVSELVVWWDGFRLSENYYEWSKTDIDVGVDSGMAGFFDLPEFKGRPENDEGEGWYDGICNQMFRDDQSEDAVIAYGNGVVSSSGYGDGGYDCYVAKYPSGEIIMAKIVFISDEEL